MLRFRVALSVVPLLALVPACQERAPEPQTPAAGHLVVRDARTYSRPTPVTPGAAPVNRFSPTAGSVHIDERIIRACGNLPELYFSFDSAQIAGPAADRLHRVARCFSVGPLKGRTMKLVGRADPRGGAMYNLALGQERAASVARFLTEAGVPASNISTLSKGDIDATGTDEASWAQDRRVDIVLGN